MFIYQFENHNKLIRDRQTAINFIKAGMKIESVEHPRQCIKYRRDVTYRKYLKSRDVYSADGMIDCGSVQDFDMVYNNIWTEISYHLNNNSARQLFKTVDKKYQ